MRKLLLAISAGLVVALAALPAASARLAAAPTVVTGSASAVTTHSATLGGTVTPNGQPTRYWFEYGTSTSYGFQTPHRPAGAGQSPVAVSANVHGLTPGTVYHFRLDAANASGTVEGADGTFTTGALSAPTAVTGSASGISEHDAALGGSVNPDGQATRYWFEYGTSTSYGAQTPHRFAGNGTAPVPVSAFLHGLTPGTLYHFRLDAANAGGTVQGPDATFTTAASSPPVVVTGSASSITGHTAVLGGSVNPDGQATRYWFEYGTSTSYGAQTPHRFAGNGTAPVPVSAFLHGLTPGTLYHFRIDASSRAGTVEGADATFTTAASSPPVVVTGSASSITGHTAVLGGTVTPNGLPTRYWFEYGTSTSYGAQTPHGFAGNGTAPVPVSAFLHGLTPGTLYHFRIDASSRAGTVEGADATFTTAASSPPVVVTGSASSITGHTAVLGGSVNPNGLPTRYWFEYGTSTSYGAQTPHRFAGNGTAPVPVSAFLHGLTPGTLYHFRIDASSRAGTVEGADATFTTAAGAAPTVDTGSATVIHEHSARVDGSVNPNGQRTRYWFEYGTSTSYGQHTPIRFAGRGDNPIEVAARLRGLTAGTLYHFRLDASNASGTVQGVDATFTTAVGSAPGATTDAARDITEHSARIGGSVAPNGQLTRYWFEYGTSTSYGRRTPTRFVGRGYRPRKVAATLRGLDPGTLYHFRLDAANRSGTTQGEDETFTTASARSPHEWFAGSVSAVGSNSITVGVSWTGPHDGSLNGQTVTVAVVTRTRITQGPHNTPIALAQIQPNELVALHTFGQIPAGLTALRIHVYCDCHWVGGAISGIDPATGSLTIQVRHTGPYDRVLDGQNVTIHTNIDTVYMKGPHKRRIAFSDLRVGQAVGIVFGANAFFQAPGFNWQTATFTAKRIHVWGRGEVPPPSSDGDLAAATSVPG